MNTPKWRAVIDPRDTATATTLRAISMDGYCWRESWELLYEGGLSLMWKLSIANNMSPQSIERIFQCGLLTNDAQDFHGRSFLLTSWASNRKRASPYFAALIDRASLNGLSHGLVKCIASDHVIRYCPICMDYRYHSVYFQIDGLKSCPIHNELLRDSCRHCGRKIGRYSWTAATMLAPFSCPHCRRPLGNGKPAVTPRDFNLHLDTSALTSLADFTKLLKGCQIDWPSYEYWRYGADPTTQEEALKRAAVFTIYRRLVPNSLSEAHLNQTIVHLYDAGVGKSEDTIDIDDKYRNRERIFTRIKCYIWRRLLRQHGGNCEERTRNALHMYVSPMYPDRPVCPLWFAYYLWQFHFIDLDPQPPPFQHRVEQPIWLRQVIRTWPCETFISDKSWRMFCIWTFLSYIEIAYAWNRLVESDEKGGITHESLLKALGHLRLDMVPDWQAVPGNISFLRHKPYGVENTSCYLVSGNTSTLFHRLLNGEIHADCSS